MEPTDLAQFACFTCTHLRVYACMLFLLVLLVWYLLV